MKEISVFELMQDAGCRMQDVRLVMQWVIELTELT